MLVFFFKGTLKNGRRCIREGGEVGGGVRCRNMIGAVASSGETVTP